jgi:hypothetical protein
MKFVVGLAAGVALAAAAYVYAQRNPVMQEAMEGIQADLKAGDSEALKARLEAGLAEVRSQVQQRVGPQSDWAADTGDALMVATDEVVGAAEESAGAAEGSVGAVLAAADELAPPADVTEPATEA